MDEFSAIRNYQRIFKPDRRVYSWDGKPIPVPGGVPLWWLLYFAGTVITVIVLTSGSLLLGVLFAVVAGLCGLYIGNAASAAVAAIGAFLLVPVVGGALSQIDWPLRLLIVPGALATLAIQVAPDGRRPHRYVMTWLSFCLRGHRRSLGRAVTIDGAPSASYRPELWVAPDHRSTALRRARIRGRGIVRFRDELAVSRRRRRRVVRARQLGSGQKRRRGEVVMDSVELEPGQILEVRP